MSCPGSPERVPSGGTGTGKRRPGLCGQDRGEVIGDARVAVGRIQGEVGLHRAAPVVGEDLRGALFHAVERDVRHVRRGELGTSS